MDVQRSILAATNGPDKEKVRDSIQESSNLSERWNDRRCQEEADKLVQFLLRPKMLKFLALHEAGHVIYYARCRCTVALLSPRIIHDRAKDLFVQQRSATYISNCQVVGDDEWSKLAQGYAAGGRCAAELMPEMDYAGDTIDQEQFTELHAKHHPGESGETMWLGAQAVVNKDLRDGWLRTKIDERADKISPILFPWLRH